ncbi:MAG: hypothetical protein D4R92_03240 [Actinobacteria bacterium]|nr:MAG: hypothetical protein D4R92_03240 [Actinomycetota bacterium]
MGLSGFKIKSLGNRFDSWFHVGLMFATTIHPLAIANMRVINACMIKFVRTANKSRWFGTAKSFVDYSTKQPTRHLGMHLT